EMQRRHIHHKRVRWTLRHACMASLSRRTESIRNRRDSHVDLVDLDDWQERVCSTCCDAGKVFAEETGRLIGKKNGGVVLRMYDDRAGRTGRDAIIAFRTAFKEQLFSHRTRRTQPVNTRR